MIIGACSPNMSWTLFSDSVTSLPDLTILYSPAAPMPPMMPSFVTRLVTNPSTERNPEAATFRPVPVICDRA
jgi:hypothetical protein